jgi:hypothetical protein
MEQAKAQEVTLKRAIEGPSTGDAQNEKEQRALVKAGDVPMLIPSPTSGDVQGARKVAKTIKAPILLCATHLTLTQPSILTDVKRTGSSDHREQGRHRWGSQSLARLVGRFSESLSAVFVTKLRSGATGGHMLPVGPAY